MSTPKPSSPSSSVLDAGGEASRKLLKEELPEILVEENANQNNEAEAKVIDEDDGLRFNCEEIELFARIIQVLDTGDEASRKSMKEELLKILEKENSKQNDETEAKMIDRNGGLAVDKAKVDSSKETEEEKSKQNDETKDIFRVFKRSRSGCLDDFVAKYYREDIGGVQLEFEHPEKFFKAWPAAAIHADRNKVKIDYMSSDPQFPLTMNPFLR